MAIYKFSNMKQLKNTMNKFLKQVLSEVADECIAKLIENVNDTMYEWTPSRYKRTNEVLKSISRTKVEDINGISVVRVYFNTSKIKPHVYAGSTWNAHADFWGDTVSGEDILNWIESGTKNKYYSHDGYEFFKETLEWVNSEINILFKESLRNKGFTV